MIRRAAGPLVLALLLVLSGCDDSADLTGSAAPDGGDAETHATSFSSDNIAGGDLQVEGMVTTTGDAEGRVEFDVRSQKAEKRGGASPLLKALPSEVSFSGRTMRYTTEAGETRSVQLSQRDAQMLKSALEARRNARTAPPPAIPRGGSRTEQMAADEMVETLREQGFRVEALDGPRYRVTQPNPNGGAVVTAIVNTETGTFEETRSRLDGNDVVRIQPPSSKSGTALPQVERLDE